MPPAKNAVKSEGELWRAQQPVAEAALNFVTGYLGCGMGASDAPLTADGKARLLAILRAVSFVESRHGTAGTNQPARDPIQCGNPGDAWWKELTGQSGTGSRLIRGQGLDAVWANEVAATAEARAGFPATAALGKLADVNVGHRDPAFSPAHSYLWGTIYLIHRTNTTAGDRTFQCRDLSRSRLINGAVAYNAGGDSAYRAKIEAALKEFGDPLARPEAFLRPAGHVATPADLVAALIQATKDAAPRPVTCVELQLDPETGRATMVRVVFDKSA